MEDYGNHVEILGVKFPAVNIQIWPESPEVHTITYDDGIPIAFGIYFELMFENGSVLTIHQEAADCANGMCEEHCQGDLDPEDFVHHFVIQEFSKVQTVEPSFVYHCSGEHELVTMLQDLKEGLSEPRAA